MDENKFVTTPKYGWAHLKLGVYDGLLSYIDDVPMLLLQLARDYRERRTAACTFDSEGYSFCVILADFSLDILEYKDEKPEHFHSTIDPDDFCKGVLQDLLRDIDIWAATFYSPEYETKKYEAYRNNRKLIEQELEKHTKR